MSNYSLAIGILICLIFISLITTFSIMLARMHIGKVKKYTQQLFEKDLEFQRNITQTIIETQEQVLQNISRDLHDDAGQQITALNFQIENYKYDHPEQSERLESLSESLKRLSQSVRSISHSLNSQLVLQQDVAKAIRTEMERLQKNSNIQFEMDLGDAQPFLKDDEKLIIYRIFQESINNCIKHARAKTIRVQLAAQPKFRLQIEDDGKGFDVTTKTLSLGLVNMKKRAELIQCSLIIDSKPGRGTQITLQRN
ncbi:sensor histidine kinase [Flavobacterium sp.]|uniref:sensor histidine kinase n=2 Tax=Flavobacterium sp. TaxID=239 RepID=UPI00391C82D7